MQNDYRNYSEEDLNKLKRIKIYRFLGFSILEIKEIFENNLTIHTLLQQKADSLEEESESLKEKQEICLQLMKDDNNEIEVVNKYIEQIDFLESTELKEVKKTLVESAVPNIFAAIVQSLICLGPIGGLIICLIEKRYETIALLIPLSYFSLRWMESIWRYYLNYRKKHKQKTAEQNKSNSLVLPMALLSIFILIGGVILFESLYSKYLVPDNFLFYERSQFSITGIILLILIGFIFIFVAVLQKLNIHRSGDFDALVNWTLTRSNKLKASIVVIWMALLYVSLSQATIVTADKIIVRNCLHPIGISYSYNDVEKIEAGFGQNSFSFAEYQKKGQFHYIIWINGHKVVFMTPTVNENIDRYNDTYLELEEFDQKLVKLNIPKTASEEGSKYCYYDQIYVDRFIRIINNK